VLERAQVEAAAALLARFRDATLELAQAKYAAAYGLPDLTAIRRGLAGPNPARADVQFGDQVALAWRNRFMAANLTVLYCEAASRGHPLNVVTGEAHVPGLKALLEQAAQGRLTVAVGERNATTLPDGTRAPFEDLPLQMGDEGGRTAAIMQRADLRFTLDMDARIRIVASDGSSPEGELWAQWRHSFLSQLARPNIDPDVRAFIEYLAGQHPEFRKELEARGYP
jgi:hypothetical protein